MSGLTVGLRDNSDIPRNASNNSVLWNCGVVLSPYTILSETMAMIQITQTIQRFLPLPFKINKVTYPAYGALISGTSLVDKLGIAAVLLPRAAHQLIKSHNPHPAKFLLSVFVSFLLPTINL